RRQVECERPRGRPLSHDDVEPEVLEGRIEDLLRGAAEPVDLVDEDDVTRLDRREDRGHVLPLEGGAGDRADAGAGLLADDVRKARLAETRGADQKDVVERVTSSLRGIERDRKLLLDTGLADEVVQPAGPKALLDLLVLLAEVGSEELSACVHAAFFN